MTASINLLPGPVHIHPLVQRAFCRPPVSHRAEVFLEDVTLTRRLLCNLVGAEEAVLVLGSGTLANDAVALQLAQHGKHGIVMSNGEFGERLIDHARRHQLRHTVLAAPWGKRLDYVHLARHLERDRAIEWIWAAHCETSTGILNDLPLLTRLCTEHGVKLCVDAISSVGTVPVDLSHAFLATAVSGKGLASYPGIGIVFFQRGKLATGQKLPRYLDLSAYAAKQSVPFTTSSNLLGALLVALELLDPPKRFARIYRASMALRAALAARGLRIMAPENDASPAVITIMLPDRCCSLRIGDRLAELGYLLSYRSEYLVRRNLIQVCIMGNMVDTDLAPVAEHLAGAIAACATAGESSAAGKVGQTEKKL